MADILKLDEARIDLACRAHWTDFDTCDAVKRRAYLDNMRAAITAYLQSGPERAAGEMRALTEALIELRDEQTSDSIFGGQTTQQRRTASEVYASRIREAADKLLGLLDAAEAALAKSEPQP